MHRSAPRTATTRIVTEINRTVVIDSVRAGGRLSRRQIREQTGLSSATIDRITATLIADGTLVADGFDRSSGGRPSQLLRYSGAPRLVIAVQMTQFSVSGRLYDLDGREVGHARRDLEPHTSELGAARLETTLHLIEDLLAIAAEAGRPCLGVGIVVPAIVHDGRVTTTIELGWSDTPLASIVESRWGLPVLVENDANAVALGESVGGVAKGASTVVSLVLGVGVGAGIVTDGTIFRGARSAAGEVGFLLTDRSALRHDFTDAGDLELRIAALAPDRAHPETLGALLESAASGQESAEAAASELMDLVALTCAAMSIVIDPAVIVLAGNLARTPEYTVEQISRRLIGRIPSLPRLLIGTLGEQAAIEGVRVLITRHVQGATYLRS